MTAAEKFEKALAAFDRIHEQDPKRVDHQGVQIASGQLYARRMLDSLSKYQLAASPELRLAAYAQHLGRWQTPRADYPEGRAGYYAWRTNAAKHHARLARAILEKVGYPPAVGERVATLIEKKSLNRDAEVQCLEDVACLVFLRFEVDEFALRHDASKVREILRKTWRKMSKNAQQACLSDRALAAKVRPMLDD